MHPMPYPWNTIAGMSHQHSNPADLCPPPGGIYDHVVKTNAQTLIFISGQLGRDASDTPVSGDARAQYAKAWENVCIAVRSAGGGIEDIVKTTTYIVGAENIPAVRKARAALNLQTPPTSTMIVVAALADPRFLIEIDAVAAIG